MKNKDLLQNSKKSNGRELRPNSLLFKRLQKKLRPKKRGLQLKRQHGSPRSKQMLKLLWKLRQRQNDLDKRRFAKNKS